VLLVLLALVGLVWALSTLFQDFGLGDLIGGQAQAVEVPRVVGMDKDQAVSELEGAGFETTISRRQSSAEDSGVVLDQTPDGGQSAKRGSEVRLVVGASTVQVPQVVGLTLAEAQAELDSAGLGIGSQNEFPNQAPEGQVVEQSLQPGTAVSQGTTVDLGVSSGPGNSGSSASSSSSASASSSASSSASASSDPSDSSASAPAESPSSAPSSERQQERAEENREKIEEAREKAQEKAEQRAEKAVEKAKGKD
jgi:beta-lactam-binding protein with PASTA domain